MFKFLIIFGLIIIDTSSKEEATRSCSEVPNSRTRIPFYVQVPLQFFHLVIGCAKKLTETIAFQDQPYKQCIWLRNLKHCLNTFKEEENVECTEEIKEMIRDLISEQTNKDREAPRCLRRFVNEN